MTSRPRPRKTYSRLASGRRIPTEYELVSSDLHYNYPRRFEIGGENAVIDWYYRYREGSQLRATDWENFSDPRRTTYRSYTEIQDRKEDVVDGLLREIDETTYDEQLSDSWVAFIDHWYGPLRFPIHGLVMMASYFAELAPASRITNCAAFQAADEMRRLQRIAYRMVQLGAHRSGVDVDAQRERWEDDTAFQPLRDLVERALVTYDWGEAMVVCNLVIKPHFDVLVNEEMAGNLAAANGDPALRAMHFSFGEDARWHRHWSVALIRYAVADDPSNADRIKAWVEAWSPLADAREWPRTPMVHHRARHRRSPGVWLILHDSTWRTRWRATRRKYVAAWHGATSGRAQSSLDGEGARSCRTHCESESSHRCGQRSPTDRIVTRSRAA